MLRAVGAAVGLAILWLLMSGLYKPLILVFGAISVVLAVFVFGRMERIDGERLAFVAGPFRLIGYTFWLLWEIAKANWNVIKLILARDMKLNQKIFDVGVTQQYDLTQVIFANSITLTPGTITVETEGDHFIVHAVNYHESDDAALADMDRRVSMLEAGAPKLR